MTECQIIPFPRRADAPQETKGQLVNLINEVAEQWAKARRSRESVREIRKRYLVVPIHQATATIHPFQQQPKKRDPWERMTKEECELYWAGRINELIALLKADGRYVHLSREPALTKPPATCPGRRNPKQTGAT
jgi:hypothetical protein